MHLLIISTMEMHPWGGSEELWSSTAMVLLRLGYKITVEIKAWPSVHPTVARLAQQGASVRYRAAFYQNVSRRWRYPFTSFLKRSRPDLVLISQGSTTEGVVWMEACQEAGIPYVTVAHLAVPWSWPTDEVAERLAEAYLGARRAYFVSKENLALTQKQLGRTLPHAKVIRNPFKVPYTVNLAWPDMRTAHWACVARLDTYIKGIDILFEVLAQDKWRNRALTVTLYGTGLNKEILCKQREEMKLWNVGFAGFVPNPVDIWQKEHCLILPSRAEGLPLAIVEAMLCGRPCIVTNVSGNAELLEDNVTGFLAASPSVNDLDEAMERAWRNRDSWQTMGNSAAIAVRQSVPPEPAQAFADELLSVGTQTA
jgi:glycosyltransferase involved in cell wall biosynthesis